MSDVLGGISSMATRALLAELGSECRVAAGAEVRFESTGGVDAARRVRDGEVFDLVVLAADAMDELAKAGHLIVDSLVAIAESTVAVAVPAATALPEVTSEDALRRTVSTIGRIGYSTGPSGTALLQLFARWGLSDALQPRLVQARPGVPVAILLATGQADIGFQQLSELQGQPGIVLLGSMPPSLEIVTRFVGAVGSGSTRPDAARAALHFLASASNQAAKQRHGMRQPALS